MADDDGQVCGCIIILGILYFIYKGAEWLIGIYTLNPLVAGLGIVITIIATIIVCINMWTGLSDSRSPAEKGKVLISLGMIWSASIFVISILLDLLLTYTWDGYRQEGSGIVIPLATFLNMVVTYILFCAGGHTLKSDIEVQKVEGRKIIYFGILWGSIWTIFSVVLSSSSFIVVKDSSYMFPLIAVLGIVANVVIGQWVSRVDVKKGWEYLSDAQKELNLEKERLEDLRETIKAEENGCKRQQQEILKQQEDVQKQKRDIQKHKKDVQKIKDGVSQEIAEMKKQDKDIKKAREQLEITWKELEETMKSPFRLFLKKKLDKKVFLAEIEELKAARPGDISVINTRADKIISNVKKELEEQLKTDIVNIEDEYYYEAFLEYFKNEDGDKAKYDKIRAKYNPTIHIMTDRRNREWAEKRRFELSKIEKSAKKIVPEKGEEDFE